MTEDTSGIVKNIATIEFYAELFITKYFRVITLDDYGIICPFLIFSSASILIGYRKGDIVKDLMNSRDVLPRNDVPGLEWGGVANTPGHWAMMSSILIWKISWLILSPNGTWRNLYLQRCVLNVVRSEASSVRCIPKKALLPSTLENLVAPVSTWIISMRVGALWFSQMMALFKSFGSRHILRLPFAFLVYVGELTHGVGSVCLVMIPWCTISSS